MPNEWSSTCGSDANACVLAMSPMPHILHSILCSKGEFPNSPFSLLGCGTAKYAFRNSLRKSLKLWLKAEHRLNLAKSEGRKTYEYELWGSEREVTHRLRMVRGRDNTRDEPSLFFGFRRRCLCYFWNMCGFEARILEVFCSSPYLFDAIAAIQRICKAFSKPDNSQVLQLKRIENLENQGLILSCELSDLTTI